MKATTIVSTRRAARTLAAALVSMLVLGGAATLAHGFETQTYTGNVTFVDGSVYQVGLAGNGEYLDNDRINVGGRLTIHPGSVLTLNWVPGTDSNSMFGGTYRIATYGTLNGTFAAPTVSNSNVFNYISDINYAANGGTAIDVTLYDLLAGDANLDGAVNALDYVVVAINYGNTGGNATWPRGDINLDGVVNALDYVQIAVNYGNVKGTIGGLGFGDGGFGYQPMALGGDTGDGPAVVPEPGTWTMLALLAAIGGMVSLVRRRRTSTKGGF